LSQPSSRGGRQAFNDSHNHVITALVTRMRVTRSRPREVTRPTREGEGGAGRGTERRDPGGRPGVWFLGGKA
jgi:hypothetical protein